jgi:YVTN family beta-propeller protein
VVTNYGGPTPGNSLSVIDLDVPRVVRTVDLGQYRRPHGVAFFPDGRRVAVTSEATQNVVVVDVAEGVVERAIPTGQRGSHMLAMSADGRRIYTANIPDGTISAIDPATGTRLATSAQIARVTEGIALTPDGRRLWVGSNQDHTVTVVDAETLTPVDTLPAPGFPYRAVASVDGRRVVVPNPMAATLRVFDARTLAEERAITIPPGAAGPAQPVGVALSTDGATAYVSLQDRSQVAVVELATGRITGYWEVGSGPDGIAYASRR